MRARYATQQETLRIDNRLPLTGGARRVHLRRITGYPLLNGQLEMAMIANCDRRIVAV